MLIAINTATGERVAGWNAERSANYSCPGCESQPLTLKQGSVIVHHFAHPPGDTSCDSEPESYEHAAGKQALAERLHGDLEVPVGFDGHRRRADLLCGSELLRMGFCTFPGAESNMPAKTFGMDDNAFAVELQCSAITRDQWWQRTLDYNRVGLPVLWVWGARHLSYAGETWSRTRGGYVQAWRASQPIREAEVYWYRIRAGIAVLWLSGEPVISALRFGSTDKKRYVSLLDAPSYWDDPIFEVRQRHGVSVVVPYLNHLASDDIDEQRDVHDRITHAYQSGRL